MSPSKVSTSQSVVTPLTRSAPRCQMANLVQGAGMVGQEAPGLAIHKGYCVKLFGRE
jgi:hypothetical protein